MEWASESIELIGAAGHCRRVAASPCHGIKWAKRRHSLMTVRLLWILGKCWSEIEGDGGCCTKVRRGTQSRDSTVDPLWSRPTTTICNVKELNELTGKRCWKLRHDFRLNELQNQLDRVCWGKNSTRTWYHRSWRVQADLHQNIGKMKHWPLRCRI